jgi:hypothetical protein
MPIGTPTSIGTPTFIGGPNTALNLVTNVTVTDDTISSWSTPVNYRIVSATGSYSIGGQFLAATAANWVAGFAAYKMASGAAAPVRRTRLPRTAVYRSVR